MALVRTKGAVVNPATLEFIAEGVQSQPWCEATGKIASEIKFDLAVTTTEDVKARGEAEAGFGSIIRVAVGGRAGGATQSANRIQFSIYLLLSSSEDMEINSELMKIVNNSPEIKIPLRSEKDESFREIFRRLNDRTGKKYKPMLLIEAMKKAVLSTG